MQREHILRTAGRYVKPEPKYKYVKSGILWSAKESVKKIMRIRSLKSCKGKEGGNNYFPGPVNVNIIVIVNENLC